MNSTEERFQGYDLEIPKEFTLNSDQDTASRSSDERLMDHTKPIMSESDIVSQHESRLKEEVAAHVNIRSGHTRLEASSITSQTPASSKQAEVMQQSLSTAAPVARKSKKLPAVSN